MCGRREGGREEGTEGHVESWISLFLAMEEGGEEDEN